MNNPEARRVTPFHRALHRPQLVAGGERELMLTSMLVAGGLAVASLNLVAAGIALVIWLICATGLRQMAKADPNMSKIYVRQLKYGHYYAPFSRPWRVAKSKRIY
ncbi:conjugal transfer protein TrbD [Acinetobacter baumannii]|uniref:conjugal transfer protein TrbD n=1 Tax=Acinetobacter baumannii TaxID=470 RepID=UPI0034E22E38